MNGIRTTFDRHGRQKQNLRMRARCFMGYGIKILALRNDVTTSPSTYSIYGYVADIQLFRERLWEKEHTTIPKGILGGFEFNVLQKI